MSNSIPSTGREAELLRALNDSAAALQQSAHSQAAVFSAFEEQILKLNLYGSILLLHEKSGKLISAGLAFPTEVLNLLKTEVPASLKGDYRIDIDALDLYRQILASGESCFAGDNLPHIFQVLPTPDNSKAKNYFQQKFGSTPAIFAPLKRENRVIGVLNVAGEGLVPSDIPAIAAFANHIAIALENARLFEQAQAEIEIRRRAEQTQNVMFKISEAAHLAVDLRALFEQIHHIMLELLPAYNLFIALYDETSDTITVPYLVDEDSDPIPQNPGRGLTAYVLRTGKPLLVTPDLFDELLASNQVELPVTRPIDWLGVPLKADNKIIGVMAVQTFQKNLRLKKEHQDIMGFVSSQVAMAIQRKRAEEEKLRRNRELGLLNHIIGAAASDHDMEYILETACRELANTLNISAVVAALLNPQKTQVTIVARHLAGGTVGLNQKLRIVGDPAYQYLYMHNAPLVISDFQSDPRTANIQQMFPNNTIVSLLLVPLTDYGRLIGNLFLGHNQFRRFGPDEISLVWNVSDQLAAALGRTQLSQTHQRLTTAIEQAAESVVITDTAGTILYVNPATERVSGYSRAELIGKTPAIFKSGKHDASFYQKLWEVIGSGQTWHGRFVNRHKNGTIYTEDASITPVRSDTGEIINYVSVQHDITREVELEKQYQQAQKMEAIGQLTAGIAHDFNNLLTVINGFVELAQNQVPVSDPLHEMLNKVANSGSRASNLVRQLLAFSRKQPVEPKILNLNEIVTDLNKMLHRIIGEDIWMEIKLANDLWPTRIDLAQMEQIIVNLVVNARDAMPRGGYLTIETNNVVLDQAYALSHVEVEPGEYVQLCVKDTGTGISEEIKNHIFEPFFTTKPQGKGTGLGLATVFGIIKQNKGHLWVDSEPGQGTLFKVFLPKSHRASPAGKTIPYHGGLPTGTETILLAEDELPVRDLTAEMLLQQGYTVLTASDGVEALTIVRNHQQPIQLLITDVIMPRMNGKELADRLTVLNPNLKVLFVSGYNDETVNQQGVITDRVMFLQKPFSLATLAKKVREVLES